MKQIFIQIIKVEYLNKLHNNLSVQLIYNKNTYYTKTVWNSFQPNFYDIFLIQYDESCNSIVFQVQDLDLKTFKYQTILEDKTNVYLGDIKEFQLGVITFKMGNLVNHYTKMYSDVLHNNKNLVKQNADLKSKLIKLKAEKKEWSKARTAIFSLLESLNL